VPSPPALPSSAPAQGACSCLQDLLWSSSGSRGEGPISCLQQLKGDQSCLFCLPYQCYSGSDLGIPHQSKNIMYYIVFLSVLRVSQSTAVIHNSDICHREKGRFALLSNPFPTAHSRKIFQSRLFCKRKTFFFSTEADKEGFSGWGSATCGLLIVFSPSFSSPAQTPMFCCDRDSTPLGKTGCVFPDQRGWMAAPQCTWDFHWMQILEGDYGGGNPCHCYVSPFWCITCLHKW